MKEIVSKRTKKIQVVTDEVWDNIVAREWDKLYDMTPIVERKLREVPIINKPAEIKTKTKKPNDESGKS